MIHFNAIQYSILSFLGLGSLLLGFFLLNSAVFSAVGLLIILFMSSRALASLFDGKLKGTSLILGLVVSLSYLMITGSLVYYLSTVTVFSIFWILASLPFFAWLTTRKIESKPISSDPDQPSVVDGILAAIATVSFVAFFASLIGNSTDLPMRSPWLVANPAILVWIGVGVVSLILLAKRGRTTLATIGSTVSMFALSSVAMITFPLGYGFDPFLHQATLDHIALHGTITPKPFYYVGQYAIELITMFSTQLSSHSIDIALLPILASVLLPTVAAAVVWHITKRPVPTALASVATLVIPLSSFINTTPQGFANLWSLIIFFIALPELVTKHRWVPHWVLVLMTVATLLIHPLAGLPAALFVALTVVATRDSIPSKVRRTLVTLIAIGGAFMLPVAFTVSGTSSSFGFDLSKLGGLFPATFFSTRFNAIGDLAAYIGVNSWIWFGVLAILSGMILWNMRSRRWLLLPLTSLLLIINAIVLSVAGDFSFLIDYEQTNYIGRVMILALYVLLPLSVLGLSLGIERVLQMKKPILNIAIAVLVAIAVMTNGYYSYPRHDAYATSRGFTVGQTDHDTVASIRSHAGNEPYIVLANQAVSAAAIQDFGFAPYYGNNADIFYYPVPTGGPLYQIFLKMIEDNPTHQLAISAMDLAQVNHAYLVINEYWWSSTVAIERAKVEADTWFAVNDGATTVFIYKRPD